MSSPPPDITVTDPEPVASQGNRPFPISTSHTHAELLLPPRVATAGSQKSSEPHSPTPTLTNSNEDSSNPPSPTLSSSSHFVPKTAIILRNNKLEDTTGMLKPDDVQSSGQHGRRGSTASSQGSRVSFEVAEADHPLSETPLRHASSHATSMTVADPSPSGSLREKSRSGVDAHSTRGSIAPSESEKSGNLGPPTNQRVKLEDQEDVTDPTPFQFGPSQLASLVDPKNFPELRTLGGITAILKGLGTHPRHGLSLEPEHFTEKSRNRGASVGDKSAASREASEAPQVTLPDVIVTSPSGVESKGNGNGGGFSDGPAYAADLGTRLRVFGENALPPRRSKTLLELMWLALKDKVLMLLSVAAVISLALGLFQDFGTPRQPGQKPVDWIEGVAIMVAILIVVVVGSLNDYQKERQFRVLNQKKEERGVKVIRNGVEHIVDIKEVVVGDIALLEPGEIVPCDGIFLSGHNVKCDESSVTGESDTIKKISYDDCLTRYRAAMSEEIGAVGGGAGPSHHRDAHHLGGDAHVDCFIISGSKVLEGIGRYVVIAVGKRSFNGRIMMALRGEAEDTPLQGKLNDLAELIAIIGSIAGAVFFTALLIRFFVQLGTGNPKRNASQKGIAFLNIFIIAVTVVVVAVPEGLPLAVTLSLAFATKRMTREKLLVRILGSCETMANASVICTDKTGTLTQNVMKVVAGSIGIHAKFAYDLSQNQARSNAEERRTSVTSHRSQPSTPTGATDETVAVPRRTPSGRRKHPKDFSLDQTQLNDVLSFQLRKLFNEAICINSTAFEDTGPDTGKPIFVGSKTETALLTFAKELRWPNYKVTRDAAFIVQMIPFSSMRKAMGVVVKLPNGIYRLHLKGASEILSKKCVRRVVVRQGTVDSQDEVVETTLIDEMATDNISRTIIFYANQTLRTIALCYREFTSWPPSGLRCNSEDEVEYEDLCQDLTLIGIVGLEDPLRPGVQEAVAKCKRAGVHVKMCTGDNVLTARSIALQCGIYTRGGIIMEGPFFRKLSDKDKLDVVPRLQVLARSSPEDKKVLVEKLKELGGIVGVTGDGTNDGPALKTAHVGFSMGIAGTEVAKEASDIILMDDNFASIVKAIMWGRCVNDAVRKFLQFQISTNITAVVITVVTAISSAMEASALSAVQLLWINIIMDTFAALALATDPASESLLDRKPDPKDAPLFTVDMYKQILFQAIYQIAVILTFHFAGLRILHFASTDENKAMVQTLVFNAFVFAQIFNSINCRRLDRHLNVFEGILRNYYFIVITILEIGVQVLIVYVGGDAFQVTNLGGRQWGISLALGVVSLPLGVIIRLLPNSPFERLFQWLRLLPRADILPRARQWSPAAQKVRDALRTFTHLRGGRRSSALVVKAPSSKTPAEQPKIPALLTMIPTLVVSGLVTNWKIPDGSLSDPTSEDPSRSSTALWDGNIEVHPETESGDPARKLVSKHLQR